MSKEKEREKDRKKRRLDTVESDMRAASVCTGDVAKIETE